jgi:tRNA C32,U32 (ribose-2'-O)-methylase TrmJ
MSALRAAPSPPLLATTAEVTPYARMQVVLRRIGFCTAQPGSDDGLFSPLLARFGLKSRDVNVFLGVFRQIEWYINRHLD